jgi:AhpD family alkylhydroperoxidase
MSRNEVYYEMEKMLGVVPSFFRSIPESTLEFEWNLFKQIQLEEGVIPNKYRQLMGLAIAAATKCQYCTYFHAEAAKLHGATEAEIESTVNYAKLNSGWSTYINGMQIDFNQFKDEMRQIAEHVRAMQTAEA